MWIARAVMIAGMTLPFFVPDYVGLVLLFFLPPVLAGAAQVAKAAANNKEPEKDLVSGVFWRRSLDIVAILALAIVLSMFAESGYSRDLFQAGIFFLFPALCLTLGGCYLGLATSGKPGGEEDSEPETPPTLKTVVPAMAIAILGSVLCMGAVYQVIRATPYTPMLPVVCTLFCYPVATRVWAWLNCGKRVGRSMPVTALFGVGVVWLILLFPFIQPRHRGSSLTACKSNLKNIGTAMEMYSTDYSGDYPPDESLLTPDYLKTLPTCPSSRETHYTFEFGPTATYNTMSYEDYYFIYCTGESHVNAGVPKNYPQYSAIIGLIER